VRASGRTAVHVGQALVLVGIERGAAQVVRGSQAGLGLDRAQDQLFGALLDQREAVGLTLAIAIYVLAGYVLEQRADEHPDAMRRWRAENTDALREYNARRRAEHPDAFRQYAARYRARKRAAPVEQFTGAELEARYLPFCTWCWLPLDRADSERDHWTPLCAGGTHSLANLSHMHARCNRSKGGRAPCSPLWERHATILAHLNLEEA
jgi:5-methylcytosine-specific restriction endonuclease McrA